MVQEWVLDNIFGEDDRSWILKPSIKPILCRVYILKGEKVIELHLPPEAAFKPCKCQESKVVPGK